MRKIWQVGIIIVFAIAFFKTPSTNVNAHSSNIDQQADIANGLPQTYPTRIQFERGATDFFSDDYSIGINGIHEWVVGASYNQQLVVVISPKTGVAGSNFALEIRGLSDGSVLVYDAERLRTWRGRLPATQDYLIRVINHGSPDTYSLMVQIPINIQFAWGATRTTIFGDFHTGHSQDYVLNAQGGQSMTVYLSTTDPSVALWLIGEDGNILRMASPSFTVLLPTTQDYTLSVTRNNINNPIQDYALTIIIPPLSYGHCRNCDGAGNSNG